MIMSIADRMLAYSCEGINLLVSTMDWEVSTLYVVTVCVFLLSDLYCVSDVGSKICRWAVAPVVLCAGRFPVWPQAATVRWGTPPMMAIWLKQSGEYTCEKVLHLWSINIRLKGSSNIINKANITFVAIFFSIKRNCFCFPIRCWVAMHDGKHESMHVAWWKSPLKIVFDKKKNKITNYLCSWDWDWSCCFQQNLRRCKCMCCSSVVEWLL